jgi:hypothetical protein
MDRLSRITLLLALLVLVGCKQSANIASAPPSPPVPAANSSPEPPKPTLADEEPGLAAETAVKFSHLSGLHSGLSQDEVMPYVSHYFGSEPYRGDCSRNDAHCYFTSSDVTLELMFNDEGKLYIIRDTPDTPAQVAAVKQLYRPMLDHYFGQSSKGRTKDGFTLLEWQRGSELACFITGKGLFQFEYTDDSLKSLDPQLGVASTCAEEP